MATYYWRGNTGNWTDSKWSTNVSTPAGSGTLPPPSASDDAVFDANSGPASSTITINSAVTIKDLNFATYNNNNILILNNNLTITGNLNCGTTSTSLTIRVLGAVRTISLAGNLSGGGSGFGIDIELSSTFDLNFRLNGSSDQIIQTGGFTFKGAQSINKRIVVQFDKPAGILDQLINNMPNFNYCKLEYISGLKTKAVLGFTTAATFFINCIFDLQDLPLATINFTGTNTLLSNFICRDLSILNTGVSINNDVSAPNAEFKIDQNLTVTGGGVSINGNTNIVLSNTSTLYGPTSISGTEYDSIILLSASGIITSSLEIRKTALKKVTVGNGTTINNLIFAGANQTIKYTSGIFDTTTNNSTIFITSQTNTKFLDLNNYPINKITVNGFSGTTQTLSLTSTLNVTDFTILPSAGYNGVNFIGTKGFTVNNFTADISNGISNTMSIKLKSKLNPLSADNNYIVNGLLTLKGRPNQRITLESDLSVTDGSADISIGTPGSLNNFTTGVTGYRVSQTSGRLPIGLNFGTNITTSAFLSEITGGAGTTWTLNKNIINTVTTRSITIGLPAYLKLNSTTGNYDINYVTVKDIDSSQSGGKTILADNSYQNVIGIPNPNMFRTVNWNSLTPLTPLVTVAYVE